MMIETSRLLLRQPELGDADDLADALMDPEVMRFIGDGRPSTHAEVIGAIERDRERWSIDGFGKLAIVRRSDEVVIGRTGIVAWDPLTWSHSTRNEIGPHAELELGWTLARAAWGFGYATEASVAVRDWVVEAFKPPRLISLIHPENVRSQAVARRLEERFEREVITAAGQPAQLWTT